MSEEPDDFPTWLAVLIFLALLLGILARKRDDEF